MRSELAPCPCVCSGWRRALRGFLPQLLTGYHHRGELSKTPAVVARLLCTCDGGMQRRFRYRRNGCRGVHRDTCTAIRAISPLCVAALLRCCVSALHLFGAALVTVCSSHDC
jgi:hypothetical protein